MDFVNMIKEFGFIVVACCAMGFFIKYMFDKYEARLNDQREDFLATINKITAEHSEEAKAQRDVTEKLSESINKLSERMAAWEARL